MQLLDEIKNLGRLKESYPRGEASTSSMLNAPTPELDTWTNELDQTINRWLDSAPSLPEPETPEFNILVAHWSEFINTKHLSKTTDEELFEFIKDLPGELLPVVLMRVALAGKQLNLGNRDNLSVVTRLTKRYHDLIIKQENN